MNEHLKAMALWGGLCVLLCGVFYFSSNCIAETFLSHHRLYLECEKDIPQVPGMILFYQSYFLLVLLSFIRAKSPKSIRALSITMMVSSVIACTIFLLFPGELGFSRTMNIQGFESMFEALHRMDKPHNLYPSLHIAFSSISAFALIKQTKQKRFKALLILWVIVISLSVILTHQHHLFDIATGFVLAWITLKFIYLKLESEK
ncbi:MAG: phosphatase PAP2 family protein [Bacteroidetes bacterium]|jgi:membrane-associated phospholipid phosphatase|nr:phosphatase PAP2 family protein [Bacteroidota bacterium]